MEAASAPPMQASATEQATRPAEESESNQALRFEDKRSDQQQQAASAPPIQVAPSEPVAWLHDTRVDVIHKDVKALWLKVNHRKVEHYTIPLYEKGGNT